MLIFLISALSLKAAGILNLIHLQKANVNLFSIAVFVVLAVTITYVFLMRKLSRMNNLLAAKNEEVEKAYAELSGLNKDLTGQRDKIAREFAESERFYAILVESASDGISFYDKEYRLTLANDAFYSVLGMTREEYNAYNADELLHPDCRGYSDNKFSELSQNGYFQAEIMLRHKAGHYITLSTKTVQIKNDSGEVIGSCSISRDISAAKELQKEMITAKEMAEASNRLKSSFLANISHEIRTPLNSVVGFSNLLLMDDITREQKEEYIDLINANSEKLLQIIGDIIDLSRLESSQLEISYDETSIDTVVEDVIKEARTNILRCEKPILLSVRDELADVSDLVFTDKVWLKRILRHLLDNAVKFTFEGEVELKYTFNNNELIFSVKDTGIGINKANIERIFEEFNQEVSGHRRPFEGLGLGLTLAKQVLDRLGGRITVTSEKGIGSVFSFSIPYRPAGVPKVRHKINIKDSLLKWNKIKCLVVDDNKDVLIYLTRILLDTGIQAVTARSGYEAIEWIKEDPTINMVLLDMQMPNMNGLETTKEIRKLRSEIPIIAQTAFILEDNNKALLQAGCDACLVKPIRRDNLISVMSSFTALA